MLFCPFSTTGEQEAKTQHMWILILKESRASITCLYKKLRAFVHIRLISVGCGSSLELIRCVIKLIALPQR